MLLIISNRMCIPRDIIVAKKDVLCSIQLRMYLLRVSTWGSTWGKQVQSLSRSLHADRGSWRWVLPRTVLRNPVTGHRAQSKETQKTEKVGPERWADIYRNTGKSGLAGRCSKMGGSRKQWNRPWGHQSEGSGTELCGSSVSIMGPEYQIGSIFHMTTQTDLPFGPWRN